MTSVREVMTPDPVTVVTNTSLGEAARLMRERDIGILPVLEGGKLVGVVTDRDLAIRGLTEDSQPTVGQIFSPDVHSVGPGDSAASARMAMERWKVRRLPVSEGGRLVGMVSLGDLAEQADAGLAGHVLKETGPDANGHQPSWPGAELTRDTLPNVDSVSDANLPADVEQDISQSGATRVS